MREVKLGKLGYKYVPPSVLELITESVTEEQFRLNVLNASEIDSEEQERLYSLNSLSDIQIAQCQRFNMEEGLGFKLNSQNSSQLDYAFGFWEQDGLKYIERLEDGLLNEASIKKLIKSNLCNYSLFKVTRWYRWDVKNNIFLGNLGINSVRGGFSYQKKELKYTDLSIAGYYNDIKLSLWINRMGFLLDTLPKIEFEPEVRYSLNSSRVDFLQKVIAGRYEKGDGILSFADDLPLI